MFAKSTIHRNLQKRAPAARYQHPAEKKIQKCISTKSARALRFLLQTRRATVAEGCSENSRRKKKRRRRRRGGGKKKRCRKKRLALRSPPGEGKMGSEGGEVVSLSLSIYLSLSLSLSLSLQLLLSQAALRRSDGTGETAHVGAAGATRSRSGRI